MSPDKDRPFIVKTNDLSVKALGTSFDVKSYTDESGISTVLMTGKVEVCSFRIGRFYCRMRGLYLIGRRES